MDNSKLYKNWDSAHKKIARDKKYHDFASKNEKLKE